MAKENTHLYLAEEALRKVKNKQLKNLLSENRNYYYLGSIAPDTFYYHKKEELKNISSSLHGANGDKTNIIIFDMLDEIKKRKNLEGDILSVFSAWNLAFIMGYISHCACDVVLHPFIEEIVGDYHDEDGSRRARIRYLHALLETHLDSKFVPRSKFWTWINGGKMSLIDKIIFADSMNKNFKISISDVKKSFERQLFFNKLFRNTASYFIALCLNKCGLLAKNNLGFFYAGARQIGIAGSKLSEIGTYDEVKSLENEFEKLLQRAIFSAKEMIEAAFSYYGGAISRQECEAVISGKFMA